MNRCVQSLVVLGGFVIDQTIWIFLRTVAVLAEARDGDPTMLQDQLVRRRPVARARIPAGAALIANDDPLSGTQIALVVVVKAAQAGRLGRVEQHLQIEIGRAHV